jgi:hypothetical protein
MIIYPQLYGAPWLFTYSGAPMADVPTDPDNPSYVGQYNFWLDTTNSPAVDWWMCVDAGDGNNNGLTWQFLFTQTAARDYSDQSSLGLNASRQPSTVKNTFITGSVTLTNALLTTSTVTPKISADNVTFVSLPPVANLTEAVSSATYSFSFIVPPGYYYKLATSGAGTSILVNLQELSL